MELGVDTSASIATRRACAARGKVIRSSLIQMLLCHVEALFHALGTSRSNSSSTKPLVYGCQTVLPDFLPGLGIIIMVLNEADQMLERGLRSWLRR